jgi:hypothetical protein
VSVTLEQIRDEIARQVQAAVADTNARLAALGINASVGPFNGAVHVDETRASACGCISKPGPVCARCLPAKAPNLAATG